MQRLVVWAVVFAVIGLVVGYLIFGRIGDNFISLQTLFNTPDNLIAELGQSIAGIKEARQNILISGAVGLGVGLIVGGFRGRR